MATTQTAPKTTLPDPTALTANLADAQERGAATFARAYDVFAKTAQAIWENEPQLFQLETDQLLKTFTPPGEGADNPATMLLAQCERLHENADRVIARMRHINDLAWDCNWRIATIYAEGLQDMWKQAVIPAVPAKAKVA